MFKRAFPLLILLFCLIWAAGTSAQTNTPPPVTPTPTLLPTIAPTPEPTEPPAILVIQPTAVPAPPLSGNFFEQVGQVFAQNREAILLALLMTLITGVLVGIFINRLAGTIADLFSRLFHFLFDNFASLWFIRWRYEKKYRETVAETVQELQGGNLVDRKIALDQMYVPSLLTEEMRPNVTVDLADRFRSREDIRHYQEKRSVGPWQAVRQFTRFVVLGAPGVGKTTYLYHLAYQCAKRQRPEVEGYLPIFIRFRELVRDLPKLESLEQAFPAHFVRHNFPNADRFIERQLKRGKLLVLLDGLDEVPSTDDHQKFIELTQTFANRYVQDGKPDEVKGNVLIVSSRKHSYQQEKQLERFAKTEVMELAPGDIERFVYNWFAINEDTADGYLAKELIAELYGNQRFMELAGNPLLLLLIAYHYERERQLPRQRAELYRTCIRTRIILWNTKRGTHRGRFGEEDKRRLLRELALHIFQREEKGLLLLSDLRDWVREFSAGLQLPDDTDPATLLDEVIRTSGLLQEWAIDRYGFSHQTLQEYFAAEAADRPGADRGAALLEAHLEQPAWREVILLYSGLTDDAAPLLHRMVVKAQREVDKPELWLLAGQCLAEGARKVPENLRSEVTVTLVGFLQKEDVLTANEREEAIVNLKLFGSDLLPVFVQNLIDRGTQESWLLAEQLLPPNADDALRARLASRLTELAEMSSSNRMGGELKGISSSKGTASGRLTNAEVRQAALGALGRLGVSSEASLGALLQGLTAPEEKSRAEAARALGRLEPQTVGNEVVTVLLALYRDESADEVRQAGLAALLALGQYEAVGMVPIPAGEFLMGSSDDDRQANKSEKPQHRLYLPAYYMDKTPVTNAEFGRFMAANGYANSSYWLEAAAAKRWQNGRYIDYNGKRYEQPRYWNDKKWNQPEQPVVGVSWYEALAYAHWAGKRLPTEAEWEKAARGDDGRLYPWGNTWENSRANTKETNHGQTTPVTQYAGRGDSPYGALDMAGNVWEWCSTRWWNENQKEYGYPYTPDDGREELEGGDNLARVLRGGSWASKQERARCAARFGNYPRRGGPSWGFRCCATSSLSSGSGS